MLYLGTPTAKRQRRGSLTLRRVEGMNNYLIRLVLYPLANVLRALIKSRRLTRQAHGSNRAEASSRDLTR